MRGRVAIGGTTSARDHRVARPFAFPAIVAVAFLAGCGGDELNKVYESYEVVGGEPSVQPTTPHVDRTPSQAHAGDFASSAPVQLDVYVQRQVAKVDILWVIDNSGSMAAKQAKLRSNFTAFMQNLAASTVDYHIGVVTTDIYGPTQAGRLQRGASGLALPYIDRSCQLPTCDPVAKFAQISAVGTAGWVVEEGLFAAQQALSTPLTSPGGPNDGFLRADAALFIVILSDEEDSSCSPQVSPSGCGASLTWGTTDYYKRFFEGLKGFSMQDLVTVGAVVATQPSIDIPANANVPGAKGCQAADGSADFAVYAPRYVAVAQETGGLATSICDSSYVQPLQNLGFLATGAKTSFTLSRAPVPTNLNVYVTPQGGQRTLQVAGTQYEYERCGGQNNATVRNAIRFKPENNAIPPALATIEIEYEVNVGGVGTCP